MILVSFFNENMFVFFPIFSKTKQIFKKDFFLNLSTFYTFSKF